MNKSLATVLAATVTCLGLAAHAQDLKPGDPNTTTTTTTTVTTDTVVPTPSPGLSKAEGKDLRNQSEAQYKARKKIADANLDLNKADCESTSTGAVKRACKSDAKAQAKKDKADAKVIHTEEKSAIDANVVR